MFDYPCIAKEKVAFLRGIYISAVEILMTWWTFSEDRNDMTDIYNNLYGSMLLVNMVFFILLIRDYGGDGDLMSAVAERHGDLGDEDGRYAEELVEHLSVEL